MSPESKPTRIPLVRGYRLGRGFWGFHIWMNRQHNPVLSIVKTPKNFAVVVGRWQHIWGPV